MPAPRTKLAALLATLWIGACASNRPEYTGAAAKPASAEAALEDHASPAAPAVDPDLEQLEASLAAYEQQLAHNESRLRAMGVRIASAEPSPAKADEEAARDDRFAAPPPPRAGDAHRARDGKAEAKAKSPAKKTTTSAERSPTPRPTTPSSAPTAGRAATKPTADAPPAEVQDKDAGTGRCVELCDLAHATCELEAKICELATRHADDTHYEEVCRRAGDDCRVGSDACDQCSP